jgi:Flp pilus assembly pilin Flp
MVEKLQSLTARGLCVLESARSREDGQALVEYALILFLVALVSIAILGALGTAVTSMFTKVTQDF